MMVSVNYYGIFLFSEEGRKKMSLGSEAINCNLSYLQWGPSIHINATKEPEVETIQLAAITTIRLRLYLNPQGASGPSL